MYRTPMQGAKSEQQRAPEALHAVVAGAPVGGVTASSRATSWHRGERESSSVKLHRMVYGAYQ